MKIEKTKKVDKPSQIEKELCNMWALIEKKNIIRASLFNFIVYTKNIERKKFVEKILQTIVSKFPCRIIFITEDRKKDFLQTNISLISISNKEKDIFACDRIDIIFSKEKCVALPSLILPHILPDLPVYLFWAEEPNTQCDLLEYLKQFANKIIFDSETAKDITSFASRLLRYSKSKILLTDLNWIRIETWKNIFTNIFSSQQKRDDFFKCKDLINISITFNDIKTYIHTKMRTFYLQAWLANCLGWQFVNIDGDNNVFLYYRTNNSNIK